MVDPRESVPRFLAQYEGNTYVEGWAKLWDRGDCLHWDKGFPNPALEETLSERQSLLGAPVFKDQSGNWQRRKALVPGCGRGVDVLLLASFGYDAYGLECSDSAIKACNAEEARTKAMYPIRSPDIGRGSITFVEGDFFEDGWLEELGLEQNAFDLVYDHLFFCALNPSLRSTWALRQTRLLTLNGHLVCLEYPRHTNSSELGPPWGVSSELYLEYLSHPGMENPDSRRDTDSNGLARVAYWQPTRTHATGIDANGIVLDRVSIWRQKAEGGTASSDCLEA
ncbi:uncharacterized protein APUU_60820A [Aspergillus puulaauensis]|uniref:Thiol methyltransferase n=1 Tax=Aspergillus puulaauensis TaxID=1220207 RepID=A0A7R7XU44_9EURO|nr:uncharacterized protein APUU_60820A [Aspergillus puulaauensis]BCS27772.1 hypothetical protein APUU_60820A [Aspergillus puulaauensis]